jgi:hypothetical protein
MPTIATHQQLAFRSLKANDRRPISHVLETLITHSFNPSRACFHGSDADCVTKSIEYKRLMKSYDSYMSC